MEKSKAQTLTLLTSKVYVTPKRILPGMFEYPEGLIYPQRIKNLPVFSIIGAVEGKTALCCAPEMKILPWTGDYVYLGTLYLNSGREATELILKQSYNYCVRPLAAQYCRDYSSAKETEGSFFLGTVSEWERIAENTLEVFRALGKLKFSLPRHQKVYPREKEEIYAVLRKKYDNDYELLAKFQEFYENAVRNEGVFWTANESANYLANAYNCYGRNYHVFNKDILLRVWPLRQIEL